MAPSRTSTVKSKHASKHAANGSGIRNSKSSAKQPSDGVSKRKAPKHGKGTTPLKGKGDKPGGQSKGTKKKLGRRMYTEKELGIQALNMITPVGVQKPKGGKKGKVFVDDRESMITILAMVQADKDGQIESKMLKARQMEEIREARKAESDKKMEERKNKLDETKDGMRKKRKRAATQGEDDGVKREAIAGTKPLRLKKKTVSFA